MTARGGLYAGVAALMALAGACSSSSKGRSPGLAGGAGTGGLSTGGAMTASGGALGSGGVWETGGQRGSGGTAQSGGATGTGGAGSGGGAFCADVPPCGGDVVGNWTVTSSCLKVTGDVDVTMLGLTCTSVPVAGTLQVSGTWTATSDGKYSDHTTTSGDEQLTVGDRCVMYAGTIVHCQDLKGLFALLGHASFICTDDPTGFCLCQATVEQDGGIGLVSMEPSVSGQYTTSGNMITIDSNTKYSYCVSGNTMTWTPQTTSPATTGTIVFQKQ
jgi:hypothetical protein